MLTNFKIFELEKDFLWGCNCSLKLKIFTEKLPVSQASLEESDFEALMDIDDEVAPDNDTGNETDKDDEDAENFDDIEDDDYIVEEKKMAMLRSWMIQSPATQRMMDLAVFEQSQNSLSFLSQLLLLFRVCPLCKADGLLTEQRVIRTMIEIASFCANPKCQKKESIWRSQPEMPGKKIPAGNFLLSFAILVAGAISASV
eukprot:Seg2834.2 transcript_id=Seg2834.2/GoldUCD/mRNA.D3Y31 product="hypothetical protein" protein_id=Seg2834.2/GoldUCD/D3Y31